jgi:hypothetical protein
MKQECSESIFKRYNHSQEARAMHKIGVHNKSVSFWFKDDLLTRLGRRSLTEGSVDPVTNCDKER